MACGQQKERSSNTFNYGTYHTLEEVSTLDLGEEDTFFWPFLCCLQLNIPYEDLTCPSSFSWHVVLFLNVLVLWSAL